MASSLINLYNNSVLRKPIITLLLTALVMAFFFYHITDFELDASADSLILENDAALNYYRGVRERYGSDDFLIVTYSPNDPLFDETTLDDIRQLRQQLKAIEHVDSIISLLDVPLVSSPPMTLAEMSKQARTLESDDVDILLAEKEMTNSPLYQKLLVSSDGKTTAMQVNLVANKRLNDLKNERDGLYEKLDTLVDGRHRLQQLNDQIKTENLLQKQRIDQSIKQVRAVMDNFRDKATLFLGGVPMIASDSISFIRSDLKVFGAGVIIFIVVILSLSFRKIRWVLLPMGVCMASALTMMGYLGWASWPVTVVSSNFVSLLLIITLSLIIHLIVRYRELCTLNAETDQATLVKNTLQSKFSPCLYTALTTMVAFGSLLVSGIRPVIDFGWMMVIGISISFLLAFTVFPAAMMLMRRTETSPGTDLTSKLIASVAEFIHRKTGLTLLLFGIMLLVALTGIPRLSVENRFIDYFKDSTEIYQGMSLIDERLGGTTPMDVIIDAPKDEFADDSNEEFQNDGDITASSYWFNSDGLLEVADIHAYLESLPETGKVLSIHTGMKLLEELNGGKPYSDFKLAVVYKRLPENVKKTLIDPYLSPDGNQLRFSIRLYESDKTLRRQQLLDRIHFDLTDKLGLGAEQINVSGMAVLYNNLLQSLFRSQILTIGAVFAVIFAMFIFLFRSIRLSVAALIPNMIAAGLVLGLMGWIGVPLDIMTITIAAISIGIGVDNSIHYIHRFRAEFALDNDYWAAIKRCHNSIARALYYTTVTVVLGFSILSLSNFIPTIYFGLLSGLAMMTALLANLMLLPVLIAKFELH